MDHSLKEDGRKGPGPRAAEHRMNAPLRRYSDWRLHDAARTKTGACLERKYPRGGNSGPPGGGRAILLAGDSPNGLSRHPANKCIHRRGAFSWMRPRQSLRRQ